MSGGRGREPTLREHKEEGKELNGMRSPDRCGYELRPVATSVLGAVAALAFAPSLLAVPAFAAGGARPVVTHVATLKEGHEGSAEGGTEGGTEVVISGSNLLQGASSCLFSAALGGSPGASLPGCSTVIVRFGSEPGLVAFASTHSVDVVSPAHKPGVVDVSVTTPSGTSATSSHDRYKYVGAPPQVGAGTPPVVTGVAPNHGPIGGFTIVTISGEHLLPAGRGACVECSLMSASFGKSAVPVLEGTPTELVVVSPPHDAGTVDVLVTAAGKQSATNGADRFTYNGPPHRHHRRHRERRRHRHHRK